MNDNRNRFLTKNQILTGLLFSILSFGVLLFCWLNYNLELSIAFISAVFFIGILINVFINAKKSDYLTECLAMDEKYKRRRSNYDILRIIACVSVIATHAIQMDIASDYISNGTEMFWFEFAYVFFLVCNPIYIAVSGGLLLKWKEERISDFYYKRVLRVFIPICVYYIWYVWMNRPYMGEGKKAYLKFIFTRIISGDTIKEAPHFWLAYTIISMYIAIPFLRYLFKNINYKTLTKMVVVIFVFLGIDVWGQAIVGDIGIDTFLTGWTGVAIIGYWFSLDESRKYDRLMIGLATLSLVAFLTCIGLRLDFKSICCNKSPFMIWLCLGIFACVFKFCDKHEQFRLGFFARLISKYSYGIILIHWWVLQWICRGMLGMRVTDWGCFGGVILITIVTLGISFVFSFLFDNLVVEIFNKIFETIYNRLRTKKENG